MGRFLANHGSFQREGVPIGCSTKVAARAHPHKLWSTSKQEKWIFQHYQQLHKKQSRPKKKEDQHVRMLGGNTENKPGEEWFP